MAKSARLTTRIALGWARRHARRFPPGPFSPLLPDTTARILVVNTTGIGDTIFCTAPIADLRESFPNATIDVLADRRRIDVLKHNPRINDVVVYPGKFKRMRATVRQLRENAYDVAIIQHANDPDVVPMVASARPKHLVGYASHTFSDLYSVKLPPSNDVHTIESRLLLTKAVGAAGTHWQTELYLSDEERAWAAAEVVKSAGDGTRCIGLNLGGSLAGNRWPTVRWAALALRLTERGDAVFLFGGPDGVIEAELTADAAHHPAKLISVAGKLELRQSLTLLQRMSVFISGDTGLLHAAAALKVPVVALFGAAKPRRTGPHPSNTDAVTIQKTPVPEGVTQRSKEAAELMAGISVDDVDAAIHTLLKLPQS